MGTALTELHCNTIKKAKAQALLCFDGDKAGKSAALKASKLLCSHEVYGGVVIFPEGKDPADMVKDGGTKELFDIMKKSTPLIKYVIETIASSFNLSIPQQKQEALRDIQEFLKTLAPLLQDEYKPFVAQTLSINQNHILVQQTQALHVEKYISAQTINVSEMNIIKSANEDNERLYVATQGLKVEMFDVHKEEFSMLINQDSKLQGLLLMDGLTIYTFKELQKEVKIMQVRHHTKELHEVIHSDGNYDKKSFEIKKLRGIIFELKKFIAKEIESES
jgi:DNA primase